MQKEYQHTEEVEASSIIVYPNRRRMRGWIILFGIVALLYIPIILIPIIAAITIPDARAQLGAIGFLVLFMGSLFMLCIWTMRMYTVAAFSGEPLLVINRAGIRVGKIFGFADIFLPWEEVAAVYSAPRMLYIRPVDTKRFLVRLSPMMRLTCGLCAMTGAPILIYQSFLDQPVEAIMRRIHTYYKRELQHHKE